jgi:4-amino-4-deoxy-L-arabinose transferase-like glycosyltransferase
LPLISENGTRVGLRLVIGLGLAALIILPRLLGLGRFITADEPLWAVRSTAFLGGLLTGDLAATLQTGHPGVTTMWTGSLGLALDYLLHQRDAGSLLAFVQTLPDDSRRIDPAVLPWMRLPTGLLSALSVLGVYLLLHSVGRKIGLLAALLLAFDPLYLAHSRVLHHDALVSVFTGLAILAELNVLRHWSWKGLAFSGVMGGLALLSKSSAWVLVPFVGITMLIEVITRRVTWRQALLGVGIWGLVALATVVLLWPAIWVTPGAVWQAVTGWVIEAANVEDVAQTVALQWDNRVPDLGILFYPVNWLLKTTPLVLLGLVCLPVWWIREPKQSVARWWVLRLLGWVGLFSLVLTLGDKRDGRYLLPVYFALCALAAFGLQAISIIIKRYSPVMRFGNFSSELYQVVGVVLLLGFSLPYHPYYLAYYNPLLGGPWVAPHLVKVGWGEGMEQAAAWLNAQPDAARLVVATSYEQNLLPFFVGEAAKHHSDTFSDYVLNYIRQIQNGYPYPEYWEYYKVRPPVYTVKIAGIDYLWLYEGRSLARVRNVRFGDGLELMGYTYTRDMSSQNQLLRVTFVWRGTASEKDEVRVQLRADNGLIWGESEPSAVFDPEGPSTVEGHYALPWREDMPRGEYQLWATMGAREDWALIGTIPVYHFVPPKAIPNTLESSFGNLIGLYGFDIDDLRPGPGETVTLTLYWQALQQIPRSYTIFVHLLDPAGKRVAQSDVVPGNGQWPTDTWKVGEWVTDKVQLTLPSTLPAGDYRLSVGWYDWQTGERLPLKGNQVDDALILVSLSVSPG